MYEYKITSNLTPWKGTQSTSYLLVGSQRVKGLFLAEEEIYEPSIVFSKYLKNIAYIKIYYQHFSLTVSSQLIFALLRTNIEPKKFLVISDLYSDFSLPRPIFPVITQSNGIKYFWKWCNIFIQ